VNEPAYGFFIAGSSLRAMNGVYIRRTPPRQQTANEEDDEEPGDGDAEGQARQHGDDHDHHQQFHQGEAGADTGATGLDGGFQEGVFPHCGFPCLRNGLGWELVAW
jgi:hypothetical protein